jgi:glycosyltransferase involved in cell wall biosynthesis
LPSFDNHSLSVLTPVHDEAFSISETLSQIYRSVVLKTHAEVIVCEDGSSDGTAELLAKIQPSYGFQLFSTPARLGYSGAVRRGLALCSGDLIFFTDSDGQYDPEDFWKLWKAMGNADMVVGRKVKRVEGFHRRWLSQGFNALVRALFGVRLTDMDSGFRLIRRQVATQITEKVKSLPYSFWAEFSILAWREGFKIVEVPVSHRSRLYGNTTIYPPLKVPQIIVLQLLGLIRLKRRTSP